MVMSRDYKVVPGKVADIQAFGSLSFTGWNYGCVFLPRSGLLEQSHAV